MKLPLPADYAGFDARRDLASGGFVLITPSGARCEAREWSWGERRRLLDSCRVRGRFDRAAFVAGFCELLVTPQPPEDEQRACTGLLLELFGVGERSSRRALVEVEAELARRFGWAPHNLDAQSAGALDALAATAAAGVATARSSSWSTIEVEGDASTGR